MDGGSVTTGGWPALLRSRQRAWAVVAAVCVLGAPAAAAGVPVGSAAAQEDNAPAVATSGPVLKSGSSGPEVAALQDRLTALGYDPGAVDGSFGEATRFAVIGFQKVQGFDPTGSVGDAERAALASPVVPQPLRPDGGPDRVEVDLPHQLLYLYKGGQLGLISHVSTGNGEHFCVDNDCRDAITPVGDWKFQWFVPGWDHGPLGDLYNAVYFTSTGVAIHGSPSVPLYPASHGCVRIPMHTAEWFPNVVSLGEPVYVVG